MVIWLISKCSLSNVGSIFLCWILLLLVAMDPTMQAYANYHTNNKSSRFVEHFLGSKKGDNVMGIHQIKQYLVKYGYLSPSHVKTDSNNDGNYDDELEAAVKKYQDFFHLDVSGVLDSKTLSLMGTPRCGNSDHHGVQNYEQRRQNITKSFYVLSPSKWDKRNLSIAIKTGTRMSDATGTVNRAIAAWDRVSALTFVGGEFNSADLKFSFEKGEHGDGDAFGPGNSLGHAFIPPDGRVHIDEEENLVVGAVPGGFDLYTLAQHELGHALGLEHSNVESSIMWPFQNPGEVKELGNDDIDGINALYP